MTTRTVHGNRIATRTRHISLAQPAPLQCMRNYLVPASQGCTAASVRTHAPDKGLLRHGTNMGCTPWSLIIITSAPSQGDDHLSTHMHAMRVNNSEACMCEDFPMCHSAQMRRWCRRSISDCRHLEAGLLMIGCMRSTVGTVHVRITCGETAESLHIG